VAATGEVSVGRPSSGSAGVGQHEQLDREVVGSPEIEVTGVRGGDRGVRDVQLGQPLLPLLQRAEVGDREPQVVEPDPPLVELAVRLPRLSGEADGELG
jgi:hypothetical protein